MDSEDDQEPANKNQPDEKKEDNDVLEFPEHTADPPDPSNQGTFSKLTMEEKRDWQHTLDHLLTLGNHHRHLRWRRSEWEQRGAEIQVQNPPIVSRLQLKKNKNKKNKGNLKEPPVAEIDDDNEDESKEEEEVEQEEKDDTNPVETIAQPAVPQNDQTNPPPLPQIPEFHVEDFLLYNGRGVVDITSPWPVKDTAASKRRLHQQDQHWQELYGDSYIEPCEFYESQRSSKRPKPNVHRASLPQPERHVLEDGVTVVRPPPLNNWKCEPVSAETKIQQSSRTLLLRCWERAVHVASQTIPVQRNPATSRTSNPENHNEPVDHISHEEAYSRSKAEQQCRALNISLELPPESPNSNQDQPTPALKCPSCGIDVFEGSATKLQDHYYGTSPLEGRLACRGCCWRRVEQTRLQLIRTLLDREVQVQTRGLVRQVLEDTLPPPGERDEEPLPRVPPASLQWDHVRQTLKRLADKSRVLRPGLKAEPSLVDTTRLERNQPLVVLNPLLEQVISNRMIQRYAKIPK